MKIGLIDVDRLSIRRLSFPNLALMKLSAWHKLNGDNVEFCTEPMTRYDKVYQTKVFDETYTDDIDWIPNTDNLILGGTGYDLQNKLPEEVEHICPDYGLYKLMKGVSIGFLTRGCPRGCPWCIVGKKEGFASKKVADLKEFHKCGGKINLLDPNLLACRERNNLLEQLAKSGAMVNFSQGLDIRFTDKDVARQLGEIKVDCLHFAWDDPKKDLRQYFADFTESYPRKDRNKKIVYVLTNFNSTMEENLYRIYELERLGYLPGVRVYDKPNAPREIRRLQRWCNNRIIHGACKRFEDYKG